MEKIRVVIAEDHPVVRDGIRGLLERADDLDVVAEAKDGEEALQFVAEREPDVLLLDMEMPGTTGVEVARRLQKAGSSVRILALSSHNDNEFIFGMLEAGAAGYLLKEEATDAILQAVRGVARGEVGWLSRPVAQKVVLYMQRDSAEDSPLSRREIQILRLVAKGWTNNHIAKELEISERTVGFHVGNILDKTMTESRTEAVVVAMKKGWLEA